MPTPFVAILMGSESDFEVMSETGKVLQTLQIAYEIRITSAHRTPDNTRAYVIDAETRGCRVFIAGAGMAAHLAGAVAAQTVRPVLGVPIDSGPLQGLDALLSTVQMPGGVPVGTLAVGKAGARNAGFLAASILAVVDDDLHKRILLERTSTAAKIIEKDNAFGQSWTPDSDATA